MEEKIFTQEQLERYSRNILLKEVGLSGQERLARGKVLIIGLGGLGSPAALYLAAAGVGTLGLVDADKMELSNLQRQILHSTASLGAAKTESAGKTIAALNPDVRTTRYHERIDPSNLRDIIEDKAYDFIIDGTDNFPAKFLINDTCVTLKKPFSHGGILGFQGQTMTYTPGKGPCYRCVFREPPPDAAPPEQGVLGVVAGIIGTLQATEALKYLLGAGDLLVGRLLTYHALTMEFRKAALGRSKDCGACGAD